jgi:EF-P beta-lysylation protein EpmB
VIESKETSLSLSGEAVSPARRDLLKVNDLLAFLKLDRDAAPHKIVEDPEFCFLVPLSFAARMRKRDWYDPLLLQVLPRAEEAVEKEGFSADAVGDAAAQAEPGLLHKYASRVLLLSSSSCVMHCRFCFRRHCTVRPAAAHESTFHYIADHPEVDEVILSGGDPLCLGAGTLKVLLQRLVAFPQVRTVRIHTRAPVADPGLISQEIIETIAYVNSAKNCIAVIHANHANEIAADCSRVLMRLRTTGAVLLNQSVLLRGINDSVEVLCDLSRALLDHGVLPYYLHQLDRVRGAWHFEVDEEKGKELMTEMRERVPGYAVPRYVREVAGEKSKRNIV